MTGTLLFLGLENDFPKENHFVLSGKGSNNLRSRRHGPAHLLSHFLGAMAVSPPEPKSSGLRQSMMRHLESEGEGRNLPRGRKRKKKRTGRTLDKGTYSCTLIR